MGFSPTNDRNTRRLPLSWARWMILAALLGSSGCGRVSPRTDLHFESLSPGVDYVNDRNPKEPWSIHIVRIDRSRADFSVETLPGPGKPMGLVALTEQIRDWPSAKGIPVAAINGDFYQRDGEHAGDPRGLQIRDGQLVSSVTNAVALWSLTNRTLHSGPVAARLSILWPDGTRTPVALNADRTPSTATLFSSAVGASTRSPRGKEWVLDPVGSTHSLLRPDTTNTFRISAGRPEGDTPVRPGTLVLSADDALAARFPATRPGDTLQVAVETDPSLRGAHSAIGGGPVLVTHGRAVTIKPPSEESYEFSSMMERHPRSAVGWNDQNLFLVTVDGRQEKLSMGMTLQELADYLVSLGIQEAINLDGGGSATVWAAGKVRNNPCDGEERPVANALLIVRNGPAASSGSKP